MSFLVTFIDRQFVHNRPAEPTFSFEGQTVIVTGASSGLGLAASQKFIEHGASSVILACRGLPKAEAAADAIRKSTGCDASRVRVMHLDLSSYASVLEFATRVTEELPRLDVLLLNAGVTPFSWATTEGNEETVTTNVVSLALLALLLHPKLSQSAKEHGGYAHITVTGSEMYRYAKFEERDKAGKDGIFAALADEKRSNLSDRYNTSKLLALFVVKQIAALSPVAQSRVIVNSVCPSFCMSDLARGYGPLNPVTRGLMRVVARPTEVGARVLVYGAGAGPETHGAHLPDCKLIPTTALTEGDAGKELQQRVWEELRVKLEAVKPGVTNLS